MPRQSQTLSVTLITRCKMSLLITSWSYFRQRQMTPGTPSSETESLSTETESPSAETESLSTETESLSTETESLSAETESPSAETEPPSSETERVVWAGCTRRGGVAEDGCHDRGTRNPGTMGTPVERGPGQSRRSLHSTHNIMSIANCSVARTVCTFVTHSIRGILWINSCE